MSLPGVTFALHVLTFNKHIVHGLVVTEHVFNRMGGVLLAIHVYIHRTVTHPQSNVLIKLHIIIILVLNSTKMVGCTG